MMPQGMMDKEASPEVAKMEKALLTLHPWKRHLSPHAPPLPVLG